jgi:hypothetical protein
MDCNTARILLDFARPGAPELKPSDAEELARHLDACPDCGPAARAERRLDECLGRAMRQVEVPEHVRKHIVARLDAERGDWYRRRVGHFVRAAAAAAAVVLLSWGVYRWTRPGPARIDLDRLCATASEFRLSPTSDKVKESIEALGVNAKVPEDLRYIYLVAPPSMAEFEKQRVPLLVFVHTTDQNAVRDYALVYLLSRPQFDLQNLPRNFASPGNYLYRAACVRQDDNHAYLVLHTGEDCKWLTTANEGTE